ncbi:hypothetical protein KSD_31570 [Ktedonobacter sp. SOSP1-85]|nr:hypothetical protein KSD_31570 [Ktedonobacter sp. SOSP1-85]
MLWVAKAAKPPLPPTTPYSECGEAKEPGNLEVMVRSILKGKPLCYNAGTIVLTHVSPLFRKYKALAVWK